MLYCTALYCTVLCCVDLDPLILQLFKSHNISAVYQLLGRGLHDLRPANRSERAAEARAVLLSSTRGYHRSYLYR